MNFYGFKKSRKCSVFVIDSFLKESFLSSEEQGETAVFAGYPFPSRFINRMPCFPRKVSYFCDSRIPPLKNKVGGRQNREPVLRPLSFLTLHQFSRFYSRWDQGIMELKLMNYWTEH